MQRTLFILSLVFLLDITFSNTRHWLVDVDCEESLNFFQIQTLNTYNLSRCSPENLKCGEYINLASYSAFHNNESIDGHCQLESRTIKYSLIPVNLSNSIYDMTPHFLVNISIDERSVINDLPLFPNATYNQILWGLKVNSIRFNANLASIEIIVSDDEHYDQNNSLKINSITTWLWDSDYKSAFDPNWASQWKPLGEYDIWNIDNVRPK